MQKISHYIAKDKFFNFCKPGDIIHPEKHLFIKNLQPYLFNQNYFEKVYEETEIKDFNGNDLDDSKKYYIFFENSHFFKHFTFNSLKNFVKRYKYPKNAKDIKSEIIFNNYIKEEIFIVEEDFVNDFFENLFITTCVKNQKTFNKIIFYDKNVNKTGLVHNTNLIVLFLKNNTFRKCTLLDLCASLENKEGYLSEKYNINAIVFLDTQIEEIKKYLHEFLPCMSHANIKEMVVANLFETKTYDDFINEKVTDYLIKHKII